MRKKIMLVDDDHDLRELVRFFLEQAGFHVEALKDGFSALRELHVNAYDLVILDIAMPYINGFSVLKSIRGVRKFQDLPVVMLTGRNDKEDIERVQQEVSDYIIKPPNRIDLLKRIEKILNHRHSFDEVRFDKEEGLSKGELSVPLRLVSISSYGMVLFSPVSVTGRSLEWKFALEIFRKLGIRETRFSSTSCMPVDGGGFEYFLPFSEMSFFDRRKLQDWLRAQSQTAKAG